jgi:predicted nuclease of predicted toxin-antitoxin system
VKFKIDENLPVEVAQLLRDAGHDVFTVLEQDSGGAKDQVVARICKDEHRALITLDIHFADIRTYPPSSFSGLIILRLARQDKAYVLQVMSRVLKVATSEPLEGQLWIVDERRVRIRT